MPSYMCLLVSWKSFLWLPKLLQDLSLQLVRHSTRVLLQEVGGQVAPCGLIVSHGVVELGNGIALQGTFTRVLDLGVDVLENIYATIGYIGCTLKLTWTCLSTSFLVLNILLQSSVLGQLGRPPQTEHPLNPNGICSLQRKENMTKTFGTPSKSIEWK